MHVVLYEPEIPQNTGSIARTCAATGTELHLVGKLGFEITEKNVRRAGLDYWPFVKLFRHESFERYVEIAARETVWLVETTGTKRYSDVRYGPRDAIVFGRETTGIPGDIQQSIGAANIVKIPIFCPGVRSLNLSNSVSIVLYEALRQRSFAGDV